MDEKPQQDPLEEATLEKAPHEKAQPEKSQPVNEWLEVLKRRVLGASGYSWQGLKACYKHEEAFRIEVLISAALLPIALLAANTAIELVLLLGTMVVVLIVELLNSAIEAVVDRIGEERHELAGRAKDLGSAAVMLSMGLFLITWLFILFS